MMASVFNGRYNPDYDDEIVWLYTVAVSDTVTGGKLPFDLSLMPLNSEEYERENDDEIFWIVPKGRFIRFDQRPLPHVILSGKIESGQNGNYWPDEYVSERVDYIAGNLRGAWNMTVANSLERLGRVFSLDFSFADETDAIMFKMKFA
jgi:hypothetical protein